MNNMDNQLIYIVAEYGCNSTPSIMWCPTSKLFVNYEEAYDYFLKVVPSFDDEYNNAEQFINNKYKKENITDDYIIIENRVQIAEYHSRDGNCARRPEGALIARSVIKLKIE